MPVAAGATKLAAWVTDAHHPKAYRFNPGFGGRSDRSKRSSLGTRWSATRQVQRCKIRHRPEGSAPRLHEWTPDLAVQIAQRTAPTRCAAIGESGSARTRKEGVVPVCRIEAPPGIGTVAKTKMVEKITAAIDEAS